MLYRIHGGAVWQSVPGAAGVQRAAPATQDTPQVNGQIQPGQIQALASSDCNSTSAPAVTQWG